MVLSQMAEQRAYQKPGLSGGRPAPAPMIGRMVSSTILTLIVIPVLYFIWRGRVVSPSEQNAVEETAPNEVN